MFPVEKMCKVLKLSRSSYYHWLRSKPCIREKYRTNLLRHIKSIFHWSKERCGSPRITKELEMLGIKASRPLVARLMRRENLYSIVKKKFKTTTNSNHQYPIAKNQLNQNFQMQEKKIKLGYRISRISVQVKAGCILTTVILICMIEK